MTPLMERRAYDGARQGLDSLTPLLGGWAVACALLWLLLGQDGIPSEDLLLDPAQRGGLAWYTGLVSNLGVLGWTAATTGAGLGAVAAAHGRRLAAAEMLRAGATLSGLLLLDDLFQLHIVVADALEVSKLMVYLTYAGLGLWWGLVHRRELQRTRWPLLFAAIAALAVSALVDLAGDGRGRALIAEDSAKFLGIQAWALFFLTTTSDIVRSLVTAPPATGRAVGATSCGVSVADPAPQVGGDQTQARQPCQT